MDAEGATDVRADAYGEVVWFGRRGAGVKSHYGATEAKEPCLREEHEVSRKAIAQGRPECFRCPVCSCAVFVCAIRTRDRGCSAHPVFPAPSDWRAKVDAKPRAHCVARSRTHIHRRHREAESNPTSASFAEEPTRRRDPASRRTTAVIALAYPSSRRTASCPRGTTRDCFAGSQRPCQPCAIACRSLA